MSFYHSKNYSLERSVGFLINGLALEINEDLEAQLKAQLDILQNRQALKYASLDCWRKTAELLPDGVT